MNQTMFFLGTDDQILRLQPIFPQKNNEGFENQTFEFKGHKGDIIYIKDDLNDNKKIASFDSEGLL